MSFWSNKAKGRENPVADNIVSDSREGQTSASGSNQERTTTQSTKFRTVGTPERHDAGKQVRVQGNTKNTGVVGRPSAMAMEGKKRVEGAVENPDGQRNRPGKF